MAQNQPHEITLKFDDEGDITAEVSGIAGPGCAEASAWLDELGDIRQDVATPDYYTTPAAQTAHIIGGTGGDW